MFRNSPKSLAIHAHLPAHLPGTCLALSQGIMKHTPVLLAVTLCSILPPSFATAREQSDRLQPGAGQSVSPAARAQEDLTMKISSRIAVEPAEVLVQMRVEPDARSRSLALEWWSTDGIGGSHEVMLEGARAAARQSYSIKRMEAGEYLVRAVVTRNDGSQVVKTSRVIVVARADLANLAAMGSGLLGEAGPGTRGH